MDKNTLKWLVYSILMLSFSVLFTTLVISPILEFRKNFDYYVWYSVFQRAASPEDIPQYQKTLSDYYINFVTPTLISQGIMIQKCVKIHGLMQRVPYPYPSEVLDDLFNLDNIDCNSVIESLGIDVKSLVYPVFIFLVLTAFLYTSSKLAWKITDLLLLDAEDASSEETVLIENLTRKNSIPCASDLA